MRPLLIILVLFLLPWQVSATGYERFEENGKFGLKDNQGSIVLPASFDALGWSDGNFSVVGQITGYRRNQRWGLLNLKKEFITPAQFESLTYPGGDRVVVSKFINAFTLKFGCIDLQGKVVIPFSYDEIVLNGLRAIVMIKNGARYDYGLIDQSNRGILPVQYQNIKPIGSLRYAVKDLSGKIALCSEEGKWVTGFTIDRISDFYFDLAVIHEGWRQGVMIRNGEIKIKPEYRDVNIRESGQVSVRRADEWKIIDVQNRQLSALETDNLTFDNGGLARVTIDGKTGLVDEALNPRWLPVYDYVGRLENQLAVVRKDGKYGLIRLDQSAVIPIAYDSICVRDNFVRVREVIGGKSSWNLYDTFGIKKSRNSYDWIDGFNGNFFPAKARGYWGALDRYGAERVACVYDSLVEVRDGLLSVRFNNQFGIISLEDQWRMIPQKNSFHLLEGGHVIEWVDSLVYLKSLDGNVLYFTDNEVSVFPQYLLERLPDGTEKQINFQGQIVQRTEPSLVPVDSRFSESEGLIGIKRDGKFGYVDRRGRLRISNRYDSIGEFHGGIAPVMLLGKWGFINTSDQIVIQPTFETVENFEEGTARVSRKGKYGLINMEGKTLLELRYDSVMRLRDQMFLIIHNGLTGLVNQAGKVLIEARFDDLKPINREMVIVSRNGLSGVLTVEGDSVLPVQFTSVRYLKERNVFLTKIHSEWTTLQVN